MKNLVSFIVMIFLSLTVQGADLVEYSALTDRMLLLHFSEGNVAHYGLGQGWTDDQIFKNVLDLNAATNSVNYNISSISDMAYSSGLQPNQVGRKTKLSDVAALWPGDHVSDHWIYLELPQAMQSGNAYTIELEGLADNVSNITLVYDDKTSRSEALHVNSIGYLPDAGMKYAYVYEWAGDLGPLSLDAYSGNDFHLIDLSTMSSVYNGQMSLRKDFETGGPDIAYGDGDCPNGNFSGADVWECDFSAYQGTGNFVISVEGIGCSFPFFIHDDVYQEAFYVTTRGLYHHRSGIELESAFTNYPRERDHHPAETDTVILSDWRYIDGGNAFEDLPLNATGEKEPYWGGWQDAADWDRHHYHLEASASLLTAYEFNPTVFSDGELNIPESGNGIPDIIDEAQWGIDFLKRMQGDDGGIKGGLETTQHPAEGVSSPTDTDQWYAYAADPAASYQYAAGAAQLAYCLDMAGESASIINDYVQSAEAAYVWGMNNTLTGDEVKDLRQLAAAWLYKQTADTEYQDQFIADNMVTSANTGLYVYNSHNQERAIWAYVTTDQPNIDTALKNMLTDATTNWADADNIQSANDRSCRMGFHWWQPTGWGAATTPKNFPLIAAYHISGDDTYRDYQLTAADYYLGGNPLNMTWVTQMGDRYPDQLMHLDSWYYNDGYEMIPGIVPYGPHRYTGGSGDFFQLGYNFDSCYPNADDWPSHELWFDNRYCPPVAEYTVWQTIAQAAAQYGSLKGSANANIWPTVEITSPSLESVFDISETITLSAIGKDWDGIVNTIEYYADGVLIGQGSGGSQSFNWTNALAGFHSIVAKAYDNYGAVGISEPLNIWVESTDAVRVNAAFILEGPHISGYNMQTDLQDNNLIPLETPYADTPWNLPLVSVSTLPSNIVDWVIVEVRANNNSDNILESRSAFLRNDGLLIDTDGNEGVLFYNIAPGQYYISIRHRNHIGILSQSTISLPNDISFSTESNNPADFRYPNNVNNGYNQLVNDGNGYYRLAAGNMNSDEVTSVFDFNVYIIDSSAILQYLPADADLDGYVTVDDYNLYKAHPSIIGILD